MVPSAPRRQGIFFFIALWSVIIAVMASAGGCMVIMPGRSHKGPLPPLSAEETVLRDRLQAHVAELAGKIGERNLRHPRSLELAADYLTAQLRQLGLTVQLQLYFVDGKEVVNIEAELKGAVRPEEIVVVGAHYDTVPGSPGANDNTSGTAALLELARLFRGAKPARTLRLVAFVNEEPPYFLTEQMGSLVYARRAKERGEKVVAMLSLETIGHYDDRPKSQFYPSPLSHFYPDTGNFIGFVSDFSSGKLLRRAIKTFRKTTQFPSEGVVAPASISGIGWSDHWSFWQVGYPAIMITDTALYRYRHYHAPSDTPEKLDYDRMARVVSGLRRVVEDLAGD